MAPEDFKRTTFNPQESRVNIFTVNDFNEFEDRLQLLMGPNVKNRYDFIFNNIDFTKLRGEA